MWYESNQEGDESDQEGDESDQEWEELDQECDELHNIVQILSYSVSFIHLDS